MKNANSIDAYIKDQPKDVQPLLSKIRQTIKAVAPKTEEAIKYGLPTFIMNGKNLVHFGGFKEHIGFYPTPSGVTGFKKELAAYPQSKGAIRFPLNRPMPLELIKKIVKSRIKDLSSKE